jgi:hypothetical protein
MSCCSAECCVSLLQGMTDCTTTLSSGTLSSIVFHCSRTKRGKSEYGKNLPTARISHNQPPQPPMTTHPWATATPTRIAPIHPPTSNLRAACVISHLAQRYSLCSRPVLSSRHPSRYPVPIQCALLFLRSKMEYVARIRTGSRIKATLKTGRPYDRRWLKNVHLNFEKTTTSISNLISSCAIHIPCTYPTKIQRSP